MIQRRQFVQLMLASIAATALGNFARKSSAQEATSFGIYGISAISGRLRLQLLKLNTDEIQDLAIDNTEIMLEPVERISGFTVLPNGTFIVSAAPAFASVVGPPISKTRLISFAAPQTNNHSILTTQTPGFEWGDGTSYELGMKFRSAKVGQITAIRFWKATSETGTHVGTIWSETGSQLAQVTFSNETASGWQQQNLSTPLSIQANTTYIVSYTCNSYEAVTLGGLASPIVNRDLSSVAEGNNGVYGAPASTFPTNSYQNSSYFCDVVFAPEGSTPQVPELKGLDQNSVIESLLYTKDDQLLCIVSLNQGVPPFQLATIDLQTGQVSFVNDFLLPSDRRFSNVAQSPDGQIYATSISGEYTSLVQLDFAYYSPIAGPGRIINLLSLSFNDRLLSNDLLSLVYYRPTEQLLALGDPTYQGVNSVFQVDETTGVMKLLVKFEVDKIAVSY